MSLISLPQGNPLNVYGRHLVSHLVKLKDTTLFELAYHQVVIDFLDMGLCPCFSFACPYNIKKLLDCCV